MPAFLTAPSRPGATPVETHPVTPPSGGWWRMILNAIPNVIAFSILGGVMYAGHHSGWKLPKLSALAGQTNVIADDWCSEHLVPESVCIECRTDLLPAAKPTGFCRDHGVAECVLHHLELAQIRGEPQLPKYDTVRAIALIPRTENNSRNSMHTSRVQFSSAEAIVRAGIDVDVVQERPMQEAIEANGELQFDPTRVCHLSSRVPGHVAAVFKTVGDPVSAGDILALVDASLVGQAKSQWLQAVVQLQLRQATVQRLRTVANSGAVPQRSVLEAESALQEAQVAMISTRQTLLNLGFDVPETPLNTNLTALADRLRFLDIPAALVASLPPGTQTASLIPIRAPYSGVVIHSEVVTGEVVDTTQTLFTVSDPGRMWLILHVRQEDARFIHQGLPVRFQSDDGSQRVNGRVAWISPAVDERTRTLQVRVVVANDEGLLRDRTFGTGRIILREEANAVVVPREAVQSITDATFVFVRDRNHFEEGSPKFFHVRQVRLGARDDQYVELLAGVLPGEVVASRGSHVLLAQLLRSNLGAGCGCHE